MNPPNYADERAIALGKVPDLLIMERVSYGWRFRIGAGNASIEFWYDPDMAADA